MKTSACVMAAVLCASARMPGQWLNYPTPSVPKTPSGVPNLGAPAPRTADGKPDLSGVWEPENTQPCPQEGCVDGLISDQYFDIGFGIKGGLPYQPWAAKAIKQRMAGMGKDDPTARCLPPGVPRFLSMPSFRRVIQTPGVIAILLEHNVTYRQIFTDGRTLPADPQPTWNGYSVGIWDGDTLVVETNGLRDGMWIDAYGNTISDAAKVIERYRRVNYGNLEIELTVDDPKTYTRPWTVVFHEFITLNTDLLDYVCLENERDVVHLVGK